VSPLEPPPVDQVDDVGTPKEGGWPCHWVVDLEPPEGCGPLAFIPGCENMLHDPPSGLCTCDSLQEQRLRYLEERRHADERAAEYKRRVRAWAKAADAAYEALTGKTLHSRGVLHPADLERAARDTTRGAPR
jgi:hypothetical protein